MPVGIAQYHLQQVGHAVGVLECDVFLPENRDALLAALLKLPRQICLLCLWVLPPLQPGIHCLLVEIVPIRRKLAKIYCSSERALENHLG